jgi:hypothetical protein
MPTCVVTGMPTCVVQVGGRIVVVQKETDESERVFWNAAWRLASAAAAEPPFVRGLDLARRWAYAREGAAYPTGPNPS